MMWHAGEGKGLPEVSIGRTDSERGLGFIVFGNGKQLKTVTIGGKEETCFVLDRTQVENLHAYLGGQIERLKPMKWPAVMNLTAMAARGRRQVAAALGRRRASQRARDRALATARRAAQGVAARAVWNAGLEPSHVRRLSRHVGSVLIPKIGAVRPWVKLVPGLVDDLRAAALRQRR